MSEVMPSDAGAVGSHCVTVQEVMAIYRIGRCTPYEQAALYLRKGPGHGIPCLKLGHSLRFPVARHCAELLAFACKHMTAAPVPASRTFG